MTAGTPQQLWMYYGNAKAPAASNGQLSFDANYTLVYHFAERGTPALDSSVWANNALSVGQPAEGSLIGTGLRLSGVAPLTLPASPSLALAANGAFTWSAWIKPAALQPNAALYSRRDGANGLVIGLDNGVPFVEVSNAGAVHATSTVEAQHIASFGWRLPRIEVIPHGVDDPPAPSQAALSPDIAAAIAGGPMVLAFGRLNWEKGLDRLIPAMASVPGAALAVAGNDEEGLRPVLERSMEILKVELSRCNVRSAVRWEAESDVCIRGRPQAMHHLFLNLALNARDAMPEGGDLTILVQARKSELRIYFQDSGPGIPRTIRSKVFEPFFTTRAQGTGLGLAFVERIVIEHGGTITVGSSPSGGAQFQIHLPIENVK